MSNYKPLGIYVHIPFCKSKCEYCDFYSLPGQCKRRAVEDYLQALTMHFRETSPYADEYEVDTIYFGGGTPSYFGDSGLRRILAELDKNFAIRRDAEITLEANPDSVSRRALDRLRRAGFNRISIGVQSNSDAQLKTIGRPHTFQMAKDAVAAARSAGFDNLSVDLMYGLPNQSREQWSECLQEIIHLKPDHISCYGLRVEEGTPLWDYRDCANLPDDDAQADMYLYTCETLDTFGFEQYEVSNFCKRGFESRHNIKYWKGDPYLGFGPSAASDFSGRRYTIVRDLKAYLDGMFTGKPILAECDNISLQERASEYLMLRLRTIYGIEKKEYEDAFRMSFAPIESLLVRLQEQGMAEKAGGRWHLTARGLLLSNRIIVMLQEAQHDSVAVWTDRNDI